MAQPIAFTIVQSVEYAWLLVGTVANKVNGGDNVQELSGFSSKQAGGLAGIGIDTVDYWATTGFIKPSLLDASGAGTKRRYSFADVLALRVAAELRKTGISLQSLRRVVEHLRARGVQEPPLAGVYLLSDGIDVYECRADELQSVLRRPGQGTFWFAVDLSRIETELREKIAA